MPRPWETASRRFYDRTQTRQRAETPTIEERITMLDLDCEGGFTIGARDSYVISDESLLEAELILADMARDPEQNALVYSTYGAPRGSKTNAKELPASWEVCTCSVALLVKLDGICQCGALERAAQNATAARHTETK
jgi:hypothetical protein